RVRARLLTTGPATSQLLTLSLHDALPIYIISGDRDPAGADRAGADARRHGSPGPAPAPADPAGHRRRLALGLRPVSGTSGAGGRSEEHTSELQSRENLVCRLLLEKKNKHL